MGTDNHSPMDSPKHRLNRRATDPDKRDANGDVSNDLLSRSLLTPPYPRTSLPSLRRMTIFSDVGLKDIGQTFGTEKTKLLGQWKGIALQITIFSIVVRSLETSLSVL